jgi:hypothetical protein
MGSSSKDHRSFYRDEVKRTWEDYVHALEEFNTTMLPNRSTEYLKLENSLKGKEVDWKMQ